MYCSSCYGIVLCTAHNVLAQKYCAIDIEYNPIIFYCLSESLADAAEIQHEFIYVGEAAFNLVKTRKGRNVNGLRAITNRPGQ